MRSREEFGINVGRQLNVIPGLGFGAEGGSSGSQPQRPGHHVGRGVFPALRTPPGGEGRKFSAGSGMRRPVFRSRTTLRSGLSGASATTESDTEKEYRVIFDAFRRLILYWENSAERLDIIEDIITLRASFLIDRALTGLRIDMDRALEILKNHNSFTTERERQQRDILIAAIDNLVDFAAAEEYAMLGELPETADEQDMEAYEKICRRYNLVHAEEENNQVFFAASMAAWWMAVDMDTVLTYMTQGDERVRAWHLSLEGISFRKSEFPPELIPPIEWGCRCFLVAEGFAAVRAALPDKGDYLEKVDPVFRESLATGGRIFSDAHRYFSVPLPGYMNDIVKRIKGKFAYAQDNA